MTSHPLIGVLCAPDQARAVEEFFELFKTGWEFYRAGRTYDVVIMTTDCAPAPDARLTLVFSPDERACDAACDLRRAPAAPDEAIAAAGTAVPVYGRLTTFHAAPPAETALATARGGAVGVRVGTRERQTIRLGYDLFDEVRRLLAAGQPVEHAGVPALDLHIALVRDWMIDAGVSFMEVLPRPAGHPFAVCLTHDIDFVGIRRHGLDHSTWGFLYRSTVGAVADAARRRISLVRLAQRLKAAASLPFVLLGWAKDFWEPFAWYLEVERNLPATYFVIPFKRRPGDRVPGRGAARRATAYDVGDIRDWTTRLTAAGCEVGVHGIDAWHSAGKGREELDRVAREAGVPATGIRMHWLLHEERTAETLERAGYRYDSTAGYNDTIGYRNGTHQVFRPEGATSLLELPLHIQDGALFYPTKLDLSENDAEARCDALIECARTSGGVLTVLWHDRSHGPERFWGGFYVNLIARLKAAGAWFGTAAQVVDWFRLRRAVRFEHVATPVGAQVVPRLDAGAAHPPFVVRMHRGRGAGRSAAPAHLDVPWSGGSFAPLLFPIDAAAAGARRPRAAGASSVEARIR